MKTSKQAAERLAASRRQLESRFDDLRRSIESELGWAPKAKAWAVPMVAFATGLAAAAWLVARRRGR